MSLKKLDMKAAMLWNEKLYSLQMIADEYGVSRQAVKAYLNRRGIDTSKAPRSAPCTYCGKPVERPRSQIRNARRIYCDLECYYSHLRTPGYTRKKPRTPEEWMMEVMKQRLRL